MIRCTIMNSDKKLNKVLYRIVPAFLFLLLWQFASFFFSPLVLPPIPAVLQRLLEIVTSKKFWPTISVTFFRLIAGLGIGIFIGSAIGLIFGISQKAEMMFAPFIDMLQTVPPVSWVVLALVWFGFNGKPCIFIVAAATIPNMVINLCNGIRRIDLELLEMAHLYHFSKWKILRHIILPSIAPYFHSALEIVIGSGWKLVVMGEVLTTSTGIGGAITTARLNIEPDTIIAWAVLLVLFCLIIKKLLNLIIRRKDRIVC